MTNNTDNTKQDIRALEELYWELQGKYVDAHINSSILKDTAQAELYEFRSIVGPNLNIPLVLDSLVKAEQVLNIYKSPGAGS